jgi:hypothetical protein
MPIESLHPLQCSTQPNRRPDRWRPCLEPSRRWPESRVRQHDFFDHLSAGHVGRHRLEEFAPAPEYADSGRSIGFVAGEGVEIDSERAQVQRPVRSKLGAIEHDLRANRTCCRHNPSHVRHGTRHIRTMRQCHQPTPTGEL